MRFIKERIWKSMHGKYNRNTTNIYMNPESKDKWYILINDNSYMRGFIDLDSKNDNIYVWDGSELIHNDVTHNRFENTLDFLLYANGEVEVNDDWGDQVEEVEEAITTNEHLKNFIGGGLFVNYQNSMLFEEDNIMKKIIIKDNIPALNLHEGQEIYITERNNNEKQS